MCSRRFLTFVTTTVIVLLLAVSSTVIAASVPLMTTDELNGRLGEADLARLADCEFDACIDTCAYFPAQIALAADILKTRHYCLISSVYVYADRDAMLCEDSQLFRLSHKT